MTVQFRKTLAPYYTKWFRDCYDSADYCMKHNQPELAQEYLNKAKEYFEIINSNWDAIEYFSVGNHPFMYDLALPEEYRGYK